MDTAPPIACTCLAACKRLTTTMDVPHIETAVACFHIFIFVPVHRFLLFHGFLLFCCSMHRTAPCITRLHASHRSITPNHTTRMWRSAWLQCTTTLSRLPCRTWCPCCSSSSPSKTRGRTRRRAPGIWPWRGGRAWTWLLRQWGTQWCPWSCHTCRCVGSCWLCVGCVLACVLVAAVLLCLHPCLQWSY